MDFGPFANAHRRRWGWSPGGGRVCVVVDDTPVIFRPNVAGLLPLAAFVGPPTNQARLDLSAPTSGPPSGVLFEVQLSMAGRVSARDTKLAVLTATTDGEHRWIATATGGFLAEVWIVYGRTIVAGQTFEAKCRLTFSECCGSGAAVLLKGDGVV